MPSEVRLIEIVGVAGAGKSTLAQTLLARHPEWRLADFIHARDPGHWRYFVHSFPGVGRLVAHAFRRPRVSWDEVKLYVYASEWHRYLRARPGQHSAVTLLDQGPLFALACLLWGASAVVSTPWFRSWKRETAARWAQELDVVVELTAPDDVLLARINERERWHAARGTSRREAMEILGAHRRSYSEVLADVQRSGGVRLLRLDTSDRRPEALADELSSVLSPEFSWALDGAASDAQRSRGTARADVA